MTEVTLVDAVNMGLASEMEADPNVVVLGEDVGVNGGVFRATANLQKRFGPQRVLDTPLSEILIAGMSIGMAAEGLKPVAEIQFMGFVCSAIDQIINHAARLRNRTRGRLSCPMVLRVPFGGGIHAPEHHSESTEAIFAHIPGLRVVIPSSPGRAYGLLLAAIRDPDPVIFMEPIRVYRLVKQEVENNGEAQPLAESSINAEVIDVATIKPLDMKTILDSVAKTGRCVIVHEAARTCGVGAEIAAQLAEHGLMNLFAPSSELPDMTP